MKESTKLGLGVLEAGLLLGLLGDALLRAMPWGLNVPLWIGALAVASFALSRRKHLQPTGEGRWLLPCALMFALAFAWRDSQTLRALDLFALMMLFSLVLLRAHRGRIRLAGLTEYALAGLFAGLSAMLGPLLLLFHDVNWKEIPHDGWKRHAFAVLRGAVIAVPLVLIFGGLFVAADAVYEGIVRSTFNLDVGVFISHVVVFSFFAWSSAGYLRGAFIGKEPSSPGTGFPARIALGFTNAKEKVGATPTETAPTKSETTSERDAEVMPAPASVTAHESDAVAGEARAKDYGTRIVGAHAPVLNGPDAHVTARPAVINVSLGIVEIGVVLGLMNALFLSFVAVQFRYFFGGAKVVLTSAGMTYAEYARRGFFELVWVAALTLPLLLAAHWLLRKENPAHERIFRGLAAGLLAMLIVIMASAFGRMRLYQSEYGQTELRLYTTAFMIWLFTVFVWFALTVLRGARERFAYGALVAALVVLGALHVLNPDDLIARTNATLVGRGRTLDVCYLSRLSSDAAPALVEILPELRPEERGLIASRLLKRLSTPMRGDWRGWNWSRAHARNVIAGQSGMLRAMQAEMYQMPYAPDCMRSESNYENDF